MSNLRKHKAPNNQILPPFYFIRTVSSTSIHWITIENDKARKLAKPRTRSRKVMATTRVEMQQAVFMFIKL